MRCDFKLPRVGEFGIFKGRDLQREEAATLKTHSPKSFELGPRNEEEHQATTGSRMECVDAGDQQKIGGVVEGVCGGACK